MSRLTVAGRHLCLVFVVLLALVGLVSAQSRPKLGPRLSDTASMDNHGPRFSVHNVHGRYVSAENAADTSSVHNDFSPSDGGLVGPPIPFAIAEVMVADGKGNVCGEVDGFYSGISAPGVNLGPKLFHGTYSVGANDGRIVMRICGDGAPSADNRFCATFTPCTELESSVQVGYLDGPEGKKIVTVNQTGFGTDEDSTGFLVRKHVWTRQGD